jgi:hypothetical protein
MAEIATKIVEPGKRPRIPVPIGGECGAAHRAARGKARLVGSHAAAAMLVLEQPEMRRDLARKIILGAVRTEQR